MWKCGKTESGSHQKLGVADLFTLTSFYKNPVHKCMEKHNIQILTVPLTFEANIKSKVMEWVEHTLLAQTYTLL